MGCWRPWSLAVIGALASTVALIAVLAAASGLGAIDVHLVSKDPSRYLHRHPVPALTLIAVVLIVAYALAYLVAWLAHGRAKRSILPGVTPWQEAFFLNRPSTDHLVIVNVELRDQRLVTGVLRSYTTGERENRELGLVAPIAIRSGPRGQSQTQPEQFLLLREADVAMIMGVYVPGKPGLGGPSPHPPK